MYKCFGLFLRVAGFTRPMSRRQASNRRELLSPSLVPDRRQAPVIFNPRVHVIAGVPMNGNGAQTSRWTRQGVPCFAAKPTRQMTEVATPELLVDNHLLARLAFQHIRPHSCAGESPESCAPAEAQQACTSMPPPETALRMIERARAPVSVPLSVETLLTQLARRHFRIGANKETR